MPLRTSFEVRSLGTKDRPRAYARAATRDPDVTERLNAATEERLKSGHAVGGLSIV